MGAILALLLALSGTVAAQDDGFLLLNPNLPGANSIAPGTLPAGVLLPVGQLTTPGPIASTLLPSTAAFTSSTQTFTAAQYNSAGLYVSSAASFLNVGSSLTINGLVTVGGSAGASGTCGAGIPIVAGQTIQGIAVAGSCAASAAALVGAANNFSTNPQTIQNLAGPTTVTASSLTVVGSGGLLVSVTGTSPAATFTPNLSSFTVSGALSGTFTNTTLGACISGSTITLNLPTNVGSVFVGFNGAISDGNLAANISVGILIDGGFANGETNAKGLTSVMQAVTTDNNNMSFSTILTGLAAGAHNVCLAPFVSAGTGTIDSTNSVAKLWMYMLP